nr:uncharacterized protein CI109_001628 [Kwoniella shandongensis]KAA5530221.1 hypothetical protein CI109_001628 [Kwoniella shandongensis]
MTTNQSLKIIQNLNSEAIKAEVEALRPNHKCAVVHTPTTVDQLQQLTGGYNSHVIIEFDDGQKWVMRIRRREWKKGHPEEALRMNVLSEVATMRALSRAGIPAPNAWAPPNDSQASALPTHQYLYEEFCPGNDAHLLALNFFFNEKEQIFVRSYAEWMIKLDSLSFDKVGSLTFSTEGEIVVGPLIEREPHSHTEPYFIGPFNTAKEMFVAKMDVWMKETVEKKRYLPSEELVSYLMLLEARALVEGCKEMEQGPWYLKHTDERGDHFWANEKGELVNIIDWEWASLVSKGEAFASPALFVRIASDDRLSEREIALIEAYEELGRPDLGDHVRSGRKFRLLAEVMRTADDVENLNALRQAFLGSTNDNAQPPETIEEWVRIATLRYSQDSGLATILSRARASLK